MKSIGRVGEDVLLELHLDRFPLALGRGVLPVDCHAPRHFYFLSWWVFIVRKSEVLNPLVAQDWLESSVIRTAGCLVLRL